MEKPRFPRGVQAPTASSLKTKALARRQGLTLAAFERLRRRADFLRAAKGKRLYSRGFTLQVAERPSTPEAALGRQVPDRGEVLGSRASPGRPGVTRQAFTSAEAAARFGFVVTKRSGGAVERSRIRRRLKEALRLIDPLPARPGYDYVIVARPEALGMRFEALQADLLRAFKKAQNPDFSPQTRHNQDHRAANGPDRARRMSQNGRTPKG
jgi:ribonuclease P protein component